MTDDKRNQPQTYIVLRPFRDRRTGRVVAKDEEVEMTRREAAHHEGTRLQLKAKTGAQKKGASKATKPAAEQTAEEAPHE